MFDFMKSTQRHFGKTVEDAFISFNRKTAATGINHWAETNIHTEPLKQWLAQWSSKASGRLKHTRTISLVHPILSRTHSFTSSILHSLAALTGALSLSFPLIYFNQRQGVEGHLSFPCHFTRRCLRPQPFIVMVHLYATRPPAIILQGQP